MTDEFRLTIDYDKFRSTNDMWNKLGLNAAWSVGRTSTLLATKDWATKEEWEEAYYQSGKTRNEWLDHFSALKTYANDTMAKSKAYNIKDEMKSSVKLLNECNGRTKEDLRRLAEILYDAVKDNGYGLTLEECCECVRHRVICESWNGIIVREKNTIAKLQSLFPGLSFRKSNGSIDYEYAVDYFAWSNTTKRVCGLQIKPQSYLGTTTYLVRAREINEKKYAAFESRYKVPVLTVISDSNGYIHNQEIIEKLKQL